MRQAIISRIATLETVKEAQEAERRRKAPFAEIRVKSFLHDRATVVFYPCGLGELGHKYPEQSIIAAIEEAERIAGSSRLSVSLWPWCKEWAHAYTMQSPDYTEEQKERFKLEALESMPELYENDGELLHIIGSFPQRMEAKL